MAMTPQRFRQIRNVFDALMEREPATRAMFLEEACQGDDELRSEVRGLMAAHEQAPGWLTSSSARACAKLNEALARPPHPAVSNRNSAK